MVDSTAAKFKCTLCPTVFDSPQKLGSHKRLTHPGNAVRQKTNVTINRFPALECPECKKSFKGAPGLAHHRQAQHGIESNASKEVRLREERKAKPSQLEIVPKSEPPIKPQERQPIERKEPETRVATQTIDPLIFALAVGQLQERCRHIAEEHDVPTALFTRQVAELFQRQTRR